MNRFSSLRTMAKLFLMCGLAWGCDDRDDKSKLYECGDKSLVFTHDIISTDDRANFSSIIGLGSVSPPSHTLPISHTYLGIADQSKRMPIYAPTTALLRSVGVSVKPDGGRNLGVSFMICEGISFGFGHINELSEELQTKIGCGDDCSYRLESGPEVVVEAGMIIGYKGGPFADGANLDFGVTDIRAAPQKLPGGEGVWGKGVYAACPYDYFEDPTTKDFYSSLLAIHMETEAKCGSLNYEIEDRLQGYWFDANYPRSNGPDIESKHLVIGPNPTNSSREFISTGVLGESGFHYDWASDGQLNRKSSDISADGNKYCFDDLHVHIFSQAEAPGFVVMEMTISSILRAEYVEAGECPENINAFQFSSMAKTFVK